MKQIAGLSLPATTIVRGTQVIHTIVAARGSFGEQVLRLIASSDSDVSSLRFARRFSPWHPYVSGQAGTESDVMESSGVITHVETRAELPLSVVIGRAKGLMLQDGPRSGYSLCYDVSAAEPVITIGSVFRKDDDRDVVARQIARQLVAMVYRGSGWTDRRGNVHEAPFGDVAPPPRHSPFVGRLGRTRARERDREAGALFGGFGNAWDWCG